METTAAKVGVYILDQTLDRGPEQADIVEVRITSHELWHSRLGRPKEKVMNFLKGMLMGMNILGRNDESSFLCIQGKQSRKPKKVDQSVQQKC